MEIAYEHFRLERQGDLGSGNTLVKAICRGSFAGVAELVAAVHNFLDASNKDPTVYVWTASAEAILDSAQVGAVSVRARALPEVPAAGTGSSTIPGSA